MYNNVRGSSFSYLGTRRVRQLLRPGNEQHDRGVHAGGGRERRRRDDVREGQLPALAEQRRQHRDAAVLGAARLRQQPPRELRLHHEHDAPQRRPLAEEPRDDGRGDAVGDVPRGHVACRRHRGAREEAAVEKEARRLGVRRQPRVPVGAGPRGGLPRQRPHGDAPPRQRGAPQRRPDHLRVQLEADDAAAPRPRQERLGEDAGADADLGHCNAVLGVRDRHRRDPRCQVRRGQQVLPQWWQRRRRRRRAGSRGGGVKRLVLGWLTFSLLIT